MTRPAGKKGVVLFAGTVWRPEPVSEEDLVKRCHGDYNDDEYSPELDPTAPACTEESTFSPPSTATTDRSGFARMGG